MKKAILSQFLMATFLLPFTFARAAEVPGLDAYKDRLRGASSSVIKEAEEFYDTCLSISGGDIVNEKMPKFLVPLRHLRAKVKKIESFSEGRDRVRALRPLLEDVRAALTTSPLYQQGQVQKRWGDLIETWNVLQSVADAN